MKILIEKPYGLPIVSLFKSYISTTGISIPTLLLKPFTLNVETKNNRYILVESLYFYVQTSYT
jgi:hypothetical protein